MNNFILKGDIAWVESLTSPAQTMQDGYLVCRDGRCAGVFQDVPKGYQTLPMIDYSGRLVIPALYDLHVHAPQYAYCGLGMDLELIDWLSAYAYPEETKYSDLAYAKRAYTAFADAMKHSYTARFCCFATMHAPATLLLAELLEDAGLRGYVGKLSMDRNAPDSLCEESPQQAAEDCRQWIIDMQNRFTNIKPIITPRFVPSCTDHLMEKLQKLKEALNVPVQSHISENQDEIAWVQKLNPGAKNYAEVYNRYGMMDEDVVMAHAVYPEDDEIRMLRDSRTIIAHCPACNANLRSGIAPVRRMLKEGVRIGLGSDIAGGDSIDMLRAAADAIQASKLYWRLIDQNDQALTYHEAFYLAAKGGGSFFGKVGSFEMDYELDALVLDDSALSPVLKLSVANRMERALHLSDRIQLVEKYVAGQPVLHPATDTGQQV